MNDSSKFSYVLKLSVVLIVLMVLISGGSYAYWTWNSDTNKNVVFGTTGIDGYIVYDEGESHFVGNFQPYDTFCESVNTTVSVYKTSEAASIDLRASIYMDVNVIGDNIAASNDVHWVITEGDSTVTCADGLTSGSVINSGTFNGRAAGDVITLASNLEVTLEEKQYTVWIWIDSNGENLSALSGETVDTNVWTQIDMIDGTSVNLSGDANVPTLDTGMIPVVLSNDGVATTVLSSDSSWYDYTEQKWANALLVTSDSRSTYLNTTGVLVDEDDILGYYVWIPRYKYKIWTKTPSSIGKEQTIEIVFESASTAKSLGTKEGEFRTHPAFTFGNEELSGFWVGKFETTGTADQPTVLPNTTSLTNQNVSTQFATSLKFAGGSKNGSSVYFDGNNTYGLTSNTNTHMMKNSEWGAVAYLAHSLYGINKEIRINNYYNSGTLTGCGASSADEAESTICGITYGQASNYPQSTTGNITGVFDMSGGAGEVMMGVLADSNGEPRTGFTVDYNSGFNGTLYDDTSYTSGTSFPSSKYYNLYTSETDNNACNDGICYGHALSETNNWYLDTSGFIIIESPWLNRGGSYANTVYSGPFHFTQIYGSFLSDSDSFRSVLVDTEYNEYYIVSYTKLV